MLRANADHSSGSIGRRRAYSLQAARISSRNASSLTARRANPTIAKRGRQQPIARQAVERGQQLAVREIARRAEDHHHRGLGHALLRQPLAQRIRQHGVQRAALGLSSIGAAHAKENAACTMEIAQMLHSPRGRAVSRYADLRARPCASPASASASAVQAGVDVGAQVDAQRAPAPALEHL